MRRATRHGGGEVATSERRVSSVVWLVPREWGLGCGARKERTRGVKSRAGIRVRFF